MSAKMFKILNFQKYRNIVNAFNLNFQKSVAVSQFKNYSDYKVDSCSKTVLNTRRNISNSIDLPRGFKTSFVSFSEEPEAEEVKKVSVDPSKDRTRIISPETSIRYLKSEAYKTVYGDEPVWVKYRRNFKGQFIPKRSRKTCIRGGVISTGNPCPVCRDEYLVLHYTNVDLLKQFIRPETGEIYDSQKIHVCQKKLLQLEVAIKKAKFYGYLTYEIPFRKYNYSEYYPQWKE